MRGYDLASGDRHAQGCSSSRLKELSIELSKISLMSYVSHKRSDGSNRLKAGSSSVSNHPLASRIAEADRPVVFTSQM